MVVRRFAELRHPQVPQLVSESSVFIQPIGAVEQHGPHLPFVTDLLIASSVAEAAVADRGDELDLWLLEPLAYTKSNEHAHFPGSVWLSVETLLGVLDSVGRAVASTGAKRLVFFNGHGGNTALLGVACREIRLKYGLMTFLMHPSIPPDHGGASTQDELGMGIHAGLHETSMVLHLRPDLVAMDVAARNVPGWLADNEHVRFGGGVSFGWLADDFGPDGHIGDPTGASAELGKSLFEAAVGRVGEQLAEVARFSFER
ncbi:MAG: creatininase family protein [Acidimicrobiales bacterium]|nr:creatininase family protein [Acidimicrobiales bacterium]